MAAETQSALNAYRARPDLVREHANIEAAISQGGYGRKQLNELVQNAADAVSETGGRIRVVLTPEALYCANEGEAFTEAGFRTLMLSHSSEKRDDQIGRFGLGFKSVIQVTDSPQIFSRSASISWSRRQSRELLEDVYPGMETYPLLRIAVPIDAGQEAAADPVLADLMRWATTVIKLPLTGSISWLSEEMRKFPHEFLLFSDKIGSLEFEDRTQASSIAWTALREGNKVVLSNGELSDEWLIFQHRHAVSPQAAVEAGSIAARELVDVTWAVPLTTNQRRKLGRFWNYFPTQHETSLRGIVNAAFKMNEDRHSMLESRYNEELLTTAIPRLVTAALPQLSTLGDPAMFLDILPSRPKEKESWADGVINKPIFKAIAVVPCLPDRSGTLRTPGHIKVQPELEEATRLTSLWESWVGLDRKWLHAQALVRGRESQVNRILTEANQKRSSVEEWLEEVVSGGELQDFENALQLAAIIDKSYDEHRTAMRRSRIVLMADGSVRAPITSRVFLPMDPEDESENLVSYDLLHHGNANSYLRALDLQAQDGHGRINRVAREVSEDYENIQLAESLWRLAHSLSVPESLSVIKDRTTPSKILVRCGDHKWRPLGDVWVPGTLITGNSIGDEGVLIDEQFHRHHLTLIKTLGARTGLEEAQMTRSGATYDLWKTAEAKRISEESRTGPAPVSDAGIKFDQALTTEGLHRLVDASMATRAKITQLLLDRQQYPTRIKFTNTYRPDELIDGPDLWWVKTYGVLDTPLGLVEANRCVGPVEGIPAEYLPFPGENAAKALTLPTEVSHIFWAFVLPLAEKRLPLGRLHELYGLLAKFGVKVPKELLVALRGSGNTRYLTKEVVLAADEKSFQYLTEIAGAPVLFTGHPELDEALAENWKLNVQAVQFHVEVQHTPAQDASPSEIREQYPFIRRAASEVKASLLCVPCDSIEEVRTNTYDSRVVKVPKQFHREDQTLYHLRGQTPQGLLAIILAAHGSKKSASDVAATMRELKKEAEAQERRDRVGRQKTDAGKVAELVGRSTLRSLIPESVIAMLAHRDLELTDQRMFDIVSNLHGASLLKKLKPALEEAGIETPDHFRGGRSAQEFVRELGFSPAMAGQATKKKPEREEIVGPVRLNPLHAYQESASRKITDLLAGRSKSTRGLVQLPTGAGKTRVAVESAVRDIAGAPGKRLIIWIAQSEELCEQAIDTWSIVWQSTGPSGERMAVSRLWGGNNAVPEETKLHLVVATIQTLASIQESRRQMYDWMSNPDLVIIDEAHGAIASSYTPVLAWFGRSFTDKSNLLLGLSATPYRGSNEIETERLVARFGRNLIEPDEFSADNAHEYLQGLGVLARVNHEELRGIDLKLKDVPSARDETAQSAMLEARLDLQQVAESTQRNEAILDHIKASEAAGPTLVFAASVAHAEALAAVLSVEGIPAAAISGKTDLGHRRAIIEDFRDGKVRVLTNFDVLTQGFDAPKVETVYVCRPTFSPNKYIQMIGRGLRGPLNGGSEEVLIVNVRDNLDQFGTELAFTKFDYLWNREGADAR
ncbi:DEAD/DEAH box helicase [Arthrobacter sp. TMN-37]